MTGSAIALAGSAALALWAAHRVTRRPSVATRPFVWLSIAIAIWSLTEVGLVTAGTLSAKIAWAKLQYLGIGSVGPVYLLFAAEYAGLLWFSGDRRRHARRLLWAIPAATVAVAASNEWHHALWTSVALRADGTAEFAHGWWFRIINVYDQALVLLGTLLLARALRGAPFRRQFLAVVPAPLVPLGLNVLYVYGVGPDPAVDLTPFGFAVSYLLVARALYRHHFFDLLPVARDIVVDSLPDGVIVVDSSRRIIDANETARRLARAHATGTAGAGPVFEVRELPVHSTQDSPIATVIVMRDVTTQRKAGEERQAMLERLRERQRRESLSILAGGLAHDFNNLMTGVLAHADALGVQLPEAGAERSHVGAIRLGAQRALDLASKMLAYAGERHGSLAPIDLDAVTRDLPELLRVSAARHCTVVYEGRPGLIYADPTQVRQVAMNLIINAADAVGESGVVTVSTGVETLARADLASARIGQDAAPGEYAFLDVHDTGAGMDAWTQERLFDPFFTTKPEGHGLGLAAVQGIVLGHRGAIRVGSVEGQGSCFRVWFPVATDQSRDPFGPFNEAERRDKLSLP